MPSKEELEQLARKQGVWSFGIGREIRELPKLLHDGEVVERMARAERQDKNGLLILTNERVIWFHASVTRRDMHEHTYSRISSVEGSKGLMFSKLTINAGGDNWALKDVQPKASLDALAALIRSHVTGLANPPQHLPSEPDIPDQIRKLAELRDQGILTEDEFTTKKADLLSRM